MAIGAVAGTTDLVGPPCPSVQAVMAVELGIYLVSFVGSERVGVRAKRVCNCGQRYGVWEEGGRRRRCVEVSRLLRK